MNSNTPSLAELEIRLAKLERQNRRLKRAGLAALVLVGSTLLASFTVQGPAKPVAVTPTLEAQRFVLKNARGEPRAELTLDNDEPRLDLDDAKGHPHILLRVSRGIPELALVGSGTRPTVHLYVVGEWSHVALSRPHGKGGILLSTNPTGSGVRLYDADDKPAVELSLTSGGPSLELTDTAGFKAVLGTATTKTIGTGESHTTSAAAVTLFGKDGKVIWRAP